MADTDQVLNLAAIIRKVDGNHSKGAAALAESILDHPGFRAVLARRDNPTPPPPADGEVAELVAWLRETGDTIQPSHLAEHQRYKRAAELLQRQAPQPPADGEVVEVVEWLHTVVAAYKSCHNTDHIWSLFGNGANARLTVTLLTRATELLQRLSPPQPVPVSERLPGPEDCTAEGRCWLCYTNVCNVTQWTLVLRSAILDWPISHWLPAHALPLPEVGE